MAADAPTPGSPEHEARIRQIPSALERRQVLAAELAAAEQQLADSSSEQWATLYESMLRRRRILSKYDNLLRLTARLDANGLRR